jgi:quinol-cytochrome oxidoreductase complex cytochrome b subunit
MAWYMITTRGDNTFTNDPEWPSTQLVGKVIARIPAIGNLPLLLHSESNMYILFLALIIILIILILPFGSQDEKSHPKKRKAANREKAVLKNKPQPIFYIIINIILVGLIIFSLWGSLTFWQPGAGSS